MAGGRHAAARVPDRGRFRARRRGAPLRHRTRRHRKIDAPARHARDDHAGGRRAGAHGARGSERRRPDHPLLLRLSAPAHPPRRHPPQPQRPADAQAQGHHHRRGVDGALRPDVGDRPIAAHEPRAPAGSLRRRAADPVRRFASVAAGRAGRRGGRAPRKRARRAVLLPGARLDGRRRGVADRARARVPSERRDALARLEPRARRRGDRGGSRRPQRARRTPSARWAKAMPTSSSPPRMPPRSASTWPTSKRFPAT